MVRVLRSPSSSFSIQSVLRTLRSAGLELPGVLVELLDVRRHPLLVVLVGEVGAEGAAADVGRLRVDARGSPGRRCTCSATSARSGRSASPGRRRRGRRTRRRHGGTPGRLRARVKPYVGCAPSDRADGYVGPMRVGVLDIGSNTGHLLVVDAHGGAAPLPAFSYKQPLRLAEHLDEHGAVSPSGIDALTDVHRAGAGRRRGQGLRGHARRSRPRRCATPSTPTRCSTTSSDRTGVGDRGALRRGRGAADLPRRTPLVRLVRRAGWRSSTSAAARWRSPAAPTRRPTSPGRCRSARPGWPAQLFADGPPDEDTCASCAGRSAPRSPATPATCCAPARPTARPRPRRRSARWPGSAAPRRRATARWCRGSLPLRGAARSGSPSWSAMPPDELADLPGVSPSRTHQIVPGRPGRRGVHGHLRPHRARDLPVGAARGRDPRAPRPAQRSAGGST